jgi:vancomycin permeability regulator SanA
MPWRGHAGTLGIQAGGYRFCVRTRVAFSAAAALAVALLALLFIAIDVRVALLGHLYADTASAPAAPVTLVLGAEVYADGRPSPALESRLDVAIALLRSGKTNVLLMSGGNGNMEIDAMRAYVVVRGVAPELVIADAGGERTMSSCLDARAMFPAARILIVSQADHVARATFICRRLGIDADGVAAPEFTGDRLIVYWIRERFALVLAWLEAR